MAHGGQLQRQQGLQQQQPVCPTPPWQIFRYLLQATTEPNASLRPACPNVAAIRSTAGSTLAHLVLRANLSDALWLVLQLDECKLQVKKRQCLHAICRMMCLQRKDVGAGSTRRPAGVLAKPLWRRVGMAARHQLLGRWRAQRGNVGNRAKMNIQRNKWEEDEQHNWLLASQVSLRPRVAVAALGMPLRPHTGRRSR